MRRAASGESMVREVSYCGIDPGVDGGLVVVRAGEILGWSTMPTVRVLRRRHIDITSLIQRFGTDPYYGSHVVIEVQGPRPHQHVVSTSSQMFGYGQLLGMFAAMSNGVTRVHPAVWKRWAGLIGQPKEASVIVANDRWPGLGLRARQHGIADAALIAAWGEEHG